MFAFYWERIYIPRSADKQRQTTRHYDLPNSPSRKFFEDTMTKREPHRPHMRSKEIWTNNLHYSRNPFAKLRYNLSFCKKSVQFVHFFCFHPLLPLFWHRLLNLLTQAPTPFPAIPFHAHALEPFSFFLT